MKATILLVLLCLLRIHSGAADFTSADFVQSRIEATNAVEVFKKLVMLTPNDSQRVGFDSTNEILQSVIGAPFPVYYITKAALVSKSSTDFAALLTPGGKMIYPLMVSSNAKSSVTVRKQGAGWVTEKRGTPQLIRPLVALRNALDASNSVFAAGSFAVVLPNEMHVLGYSNNNQQVTLLALSDMTIAGTKIASNAPLTTNFMADMAIVVQRPGKGSN